MFSCRLPGSQKLTRAIREMDNNKQRNCQRKIADKIPVQI
jgi:hypothetical protein